MRPSSLAHVLSAVVFGGTAIACGSLGGGDNCPHLVVDRQAYVSLSQGDACQLTTKMYGYYDGYGSIDPETCKTACNDSTITNCSLPYEFTSLVKVNDAGTRSCPLPEGSTGVTLSCQVSHSEGTWTKNCPVAGRRTDGIELRSSADGGDVGAYFARCAELEAIAVVAFRRLARELRALEVPHDFVLRADRAAQDEVEHTRTMSWLARRFGALVEEPLMTALAERSLFAVALENAVEGTVRETFGAAVALRQAACATDPAVRAVHARIAEEERAHAELALDLEAYFILLLDEQERAAIEAAKLAAIEELRAEHVTETAASLVVGAGLPTREEALRMLDALEGALWSPRRAA